MSAVPGLGWEALAARVAAAVPVGEVDGLWLFPPVRRDACEYGTAIVSTVAGDRRRIFTARYALQLTGKGRGRYEAAVAEVGSGPVGALAELLAGVRRRLDDLEPPVEVPVEAWFPAVAAGEGDGAAAGA